MNKLTPKQARFCEEYLIDLNCTQAAIRAGYSPKTAVQTGYENMTKPETHARIQALMRDRGDRTQIKADEILRQYASIARYRLEDTLDHSSPKLAFLPIEKWSPEARTAVSSFKVTRTVSPSGETKEIIECRFDDRLKALEALSKHLGLLSDFNGAIATLKSYGIHLARKDGEWVVDRE